MKITVEFLNDERTKAQITITPAWLGRLLRRKPKSGVAKQVFDHAYGMQWRWSTTNREIDSSLLRALELQDVEKLPAARLVEGVRIENCKAGGDIVAINHGRRKP